MEKGFSGGVWLEPHKEPACERPIARLPAPQRLVLPLAQAGDALIPAVCARQRVRLGQPLGTLPAQGAACMLHAPVSGTVAQVLPAKGNEPAALVLENDGQDTPFAAPHAQNAGRLSPDEVVALAREAGVASPGESDRPLWQRLAALRRTGTDVVVLHAVEDDPYLCVSHRVLRELPEEVAAGLALVLRVAGEARALLAAGMDIPAEAVTDLCHSADEAGVSLARERVLCRYPGARERYLHRLLFDGKPTRAFYIRPEECLHLARAAAGTVQTTRIVTVAGGVVENPQNLEVRLGTPARALLEHCGYLADPERVILGSAMQGRAVTDLSEPVTRRTEAVLALPARRPAHARCINCGRCVRVCPEGLFPNYIALHALQGDFISVAGLHVQACVECGSCAYVCPGHVPLLELMRQAKKETPRQSGGEVWL